MIEQVVYLTPPTYPAIVSEFLILFQLIQETYIEIQTEHLPQLLLRMVAALTSHLQAIGLGELTHCLRLCSKILSKVQPPLVSPLTLPSGHQVQGLSSSTNNPLNSAREKDRVKVSKSSIRIKSNTFLYHERHGLLPTFIIKSV